ncbi:MAG: hypothetical protein IJE91_02295 [Clostridia bacterium]|nr:hypothetical protein [Clostridia bacterium]
MRWQWLIFGLIFVLIPIGLIGIKDLAVKNNNYTEKQIEIVQQKMVVYSFFYWLCDFFYMTFLLNNLTWRLILGSLIMVIIFYNLSKAFVNGNTVLKFGLVQDFIIGLILTVYLIYIIPNNDLKQIIIPIVSAVYGGLLTLVGVAWTIKDNNNKKRQDELNKAKPMFSLMTDFYVALNSVYPTIPFYIPNYSSLNDVRYISLFINSDTSSFYVKSVYAQSFGLLTPTTNNVVLKNQHFKIIINSDNAHEDKVVFLTLEDVFGRLFYYELQYTDLVKNTEQDFSLYRNLLSFKEISENDYLLQTNKENNQ